MPDDRKVGLAVQFLEQEPHYWWISMSQGDPHSLHLGTV